MLLEDGKILLEDNLFNAISKLSEQEESHITTKMFIEKLNLSESQIEELLENLVVSKKLNKFYCFICPNCGDAEIEVYDLNEKYECEECGDLFLPASNLHLLNEIYYELVHKDISSKMMDGSNYRRYIDVDIKNEYKTTVIDMNERKLKMQVSGEISKMSEEKKVEKIFISHASADREYADLLVELLNGIGIKKSSSQIFYSSGHGYGVPLTEDIYDYLKNELNKDIMVIFVLSENYYRSPACLNEMGATWVNNIPYYTILLPDFEFTGIKGAINPMEISMKINDKDMLTEFKDCIVKAFGLDSNEHTIWEKDRDKFIERIKEVTEKYADDNAKTKVKIEKIKDLRNGNIEATLRFINKLNAQVECQDLILNLYDENNRKIKIEIPFEELEGRTIYPDENRIEVFKLVHSNSDFNAKRIDYVKSTTESSWV